MESKEYYQALMSVIEYVASGHSEITCEKGTELSGEYWARIFRLFKNEGIGVGLSGGDFHVTQPQYLNPIYADCIHAIKDIEKREVDRELSNRSTEFHMKYTRRAFRISIAAILTAAASLIWQIIIQLTK